MDFVIPRDWKPRPASVSAKEARDCDLVRVHLKEFLATGHGHLAIKRHSGFGVLRYRRMADRDHILPDELRGLTESIVFEFNMSECFVSGGRI